MIFSLVCGCVNVVAAKRVSNDVLGAPMLAAFLADCTRFTAPLVDGLHSIDSAADTSGRFLLTIKMKGVKTNSFFDSF